MALVPKKETEIKTSGSFREKYCCDSVWACLLNDYLDDDACNLNGCFSDEKRNPVITKEEPYDADYSDYYNAAGDDDEDDISATRRDRRRQALSRKRDSSKNRRARSRSNSRTKYRPPPLEETSVDTDPASLSGSEDDTSVELNSGTDLSDQSSTASEGDSLCTTSDREMERPDSRQHGYGRSHLEVISPPMPPTSRRNGRRPNDPHMRDGRRSRSWSSSRSSRSRSSTESSSSSRPPRARSRARSVTRASSNAPRSRSSSRSSATSSSTQSSRRAAGYHVTFADDKKDHVDQGSADAVASSDEPFQSSEYPADDSAKLKTKTKTESTPFDESDRETNTDASGAKTPPLDDSAELSAEQVEKLSQSEVESIASTIKTELELERVSQETAAIMEQVRLAEAVKEHKEKIASSKAVEDKVIDEYLDSLLAPPSVHGTSPSEEKAINLQTVSTVRRGGAAATSEHQSASKYSTPIDSFQRTSTLAARVKKTTKASQQSSADDWNSDLVNQIWKEEASKLTPSSRTPMVEQPSPRKNAPALVSRKSDDGAAAAADVTTTDIDDNDDAVDFDAAFDDIPMNVFTFTSSVDMEENKQDHDDLDLGFAEGENGTTDFLHSFPSVAVEASSSAAGAPTSPPTPTTTTTTTTIAAAAETATSMKVQDSAADPNKAASDVHGMTTAVANTEGGELESLKQEHPTVASPNTTKDGEADAAFWSLQPAPVPMANRQGGILPVQPTRQEKTAAISVARTSYTSHIVHRDSPSKIDPDGIVIDDCDDIPFDAGSDDQSPPTRIHEDAMEMKEQSDESGSMKMNDMQHSMAGDHTDGDGDVPTLAAEYPDSEIKAGKPVSQEHAKTTNGTEEYVPIISQAGKGGGLVDEEDGGDENGDEPTSTHPSPLPPLAAAAATVTTSAVGTFDQPIEIGSASAHHQADQFDSDTIPDLPGVATDSFDRIFSTEFPSTDSNEVVDLTRELEEQDFILAKVRNHVGIAREQQRRSAAQGGLRQKILQFGRKKSHKTSTKHDDKSNNRTEDKQRRKQQRDAAMKRIQVLKAKIRNTGL